MTTQPWLFRGRAVLPAALFAWTLTAAGTTELPAPAAAAIGDLFPGAPILEVGIERENGVLYYEVTVQARERTEIEVTAEGTIGEIEAPVAQDGLPPAVRARLATAIGAGALRRIERHEVRGVARDGRFVAVPEPTVFYEAEYDLDGRRAEIAIGIDGRPMPAEEEDDDGREAEDDDD